MGKPDLTGARFGELVVLGVCGERGGRLKAQCSCGTIGEWRRTVLVSGNTKSCGCRKFSGFKRTQPRHGHSRADNGRASPEYSCWRSMIKRCAPGSRFFSRYGARGISVCARWRDSFENFLADMGLRPSPKHSIDRINNDGNYEPGNCRWATAELQQRNKGNNVRLTFQGVTLTLTEWAQRHGVDRTGVKRRLLAGESIEQALTAPRRPRATGRALNERNEAVWRAYAASPTRETRALLMAQYRISAKTLEGILTIGRRRARQGAI